MKLILLLFVVYVLPLAQKINTTENINSVPSIAFYFNTRPGKPFFEPPKTPAVDTSQLKKSGWYASAMKNMEQSEYHIHQEENTNIYSSPNRKNNLRFNYDENGFSVEPRTTKIPIGEFDATKKPEDIKYKTIAGWKVSFNLDKKQIGEGNWQVNDNEANYITDNITVQYINNEEGMRQNFIVQKPLSNDDNLQLHFGVQTKLAQRFSKDKLQFADKKSNVVLSYEQLKVWDANGNPLEAA